MRFRVLVPFVVSVLVVTACSGGGDGAGASTAGVASVSDLADSATDVGGLASSDEAGAEAALTPEEAGFSLATCMRDAGYDDFPDPTLDENGNLNFRELLQGSLDVSDQNVREQLGTCRDEVGAENFGGGPGDADRDAIAEQLLIYTDCLRAEGLDVGDLDFSQPPGAGGGPADGDDQTQPGQGRTGPGFGDRATRIAGQLGLDPDDPETADALETCASTLDDAFAGIGRPA